MSMDYSGTPGEYIYSHTINILLPEMLISIASVNVKDCFCPDDEEKTCHRSIVAGILLNMGASVECSDAYRVYQLDGS